MPGTPEHRSFARYRTVAATATSSLAARMIQVGTNLAIIPLMLNYLGGMHYGIWLTLHSLLSLSAFIDFGIGNGAFNALAAAYSKHDRGNVNRILSSTMAMLAGMAVGAVVLALWGWSTLPWNLAFEANVASPNQDIALGVAVFALYFALLPAISFIDRVCLAFQAGVAPEVGRSAAAVLALAATWATARSGGSFAAICLATLVPSVICWICEWCYVLYRHSWLRPSTRLIDLGLFWALCRTGFVFLGIQICAALFFSIDNLLISATLGPAEVDQYAIPHRLFSLIVMGASMVLVPLWPAYADAHSVGDHAWIRTTLRRSMLLATVASIAGACVLAMFLPAVLRAWVGPAITVTPLMTIGLAALAVCQSIGAAVAMFWNGTSRLRPQLALGMVLVAIGMPAKLLALTTLGLDWMPVTAAAVYAITTLAPASAVCWWQAHQHESPEGSPVPPLSTP